jgi:hypothetical protein
MGALLAQNIIGKNDQLVVYVFKLLNSVEHNYNTTLKKNINYGLCIA